MKNLILIVFLSLFSQYSFSQRNYHAITKGAFNDKIDASYFKDIQIHNYDIAKNKIKSLHKVTYNNGQKRERIESYDKKGRLVRIMNKYDDHSSISEFEYDTNGNMTLEYFQGRKSSFRIKMVFDEYNNMIKREYLDNKNKFSKFERTYNLAGLITRFWGHDTKGKYSEATYSYNEKGLLIKKSELKKGELRLIKIKYDEKGKIVEHQIFEGDTLNPIHILKNTYYENGDKKSTTYIKNTKVKYVWNYDCLPEGELINVKVKDESTICIKEEIDDYGDRMVWNREIDEKGTLLKTLTIYSSDGEVKTRKIYHNENELYFEYIRTGNGDVLRRYYDKKGEISYYETFEYNENKQITKLERKGNRLSYTQLVNYQGSLIHSAVRIYKRHTYVDEYLYTFYH